MQKLKDMNFIGAQIPSGVPGHILTAMRSHTHSYATLAAKLGGRGWCGIDWGILKNGDIVAFESNCRFGGNNHALAIRSKLQHTGISLTNDVLKVPPTLNFGHVWKKLKNQDLGWSATRREGIVISVPPADGSMGYIALAADAPRTEELALRFEQLVQN
jgi:hypothetical protein